MTDKELLELAAKAAEYAFPNFRIEGAIPHFREWNPLTDDGDAFRLAVKLRMDLLTSGDVIGAFDIKGMQCGELRGDDPCSATRRAVVRAAAEVGKGMK